MAQTPTMSVNPPAGEVLWRERRFELRVVTLPLRDGRTERRGLVVHPGAAVILPVLDDGSVVLIRNHRWTLGRAVLELPAGGLDPAETPAAAAARELEEETGYRAAHVAPMGRFFAAPGSSTEVMHGFLATGLTHVGQRLESDERIEVAVLTKAEVRRRLLAGELENGPTMALLGRWLLSDAG